VTASLGVATTGPDIASSTALVEAADQALYRSKRAGRNRVTHHHLPLEDASAVDEPCPRSFQWD
jgi:predicted signal transduction protein with EAL and GGDEF domain